MSTEAGLALSLRLLDWRPLAKNTLRGFAAVVITPPDLVISDVPVHQAPGGAAWASLPAKAMLDPQGQALRDERGRIRYAPVIEWRSRELRERFSAAVIAAVQRRHPETFPSTPTD